MITLNAQAVLSYTVGGGTVETDDHAALVTMTVDWLLMRATYVFNYGTGAAPTFTPGTRPGPLTVTVDLAGGGWLSTAGGGGVLTPAQLGSLLTALRGDRNTAEGFAAGAAGGFLPGTVTAW